MNAKLTLSRQDITTLAVDAIVNAANPSLLDEVTLCCFTDEVRQAYQAIL